MGGKFRAAGPNFLRRTSPFLGQVARKTLELLGCVHVTPSPLHLSWVTCFSLAYARYVRLGLGRSFFLGEGPAAS